MYSQGTMANWDNVPPSSSGQTQKAMRQLALRSPPKTYLPYSTLSANSVK